MVTQQQFEILAFTDPVCTWCWGSEPILRKLQYWYGEQVTVVPIMGGLVEDIRNFYDHANDIGGSPEQSNPQIARHWLEASSRHGMPVEVDGFRLFSADTFSTYPQNIAYKAVELINPKLAASFLRRIREASASEARETGKREVLIELANETGVDIASFIEHLDNGSAEQAFRDDLLMTRKYGVRGFPTFLFRWGNKEILLRGYQSYDSMSSVISSLTAGQVVPCQPVANADNVLDFLLNNGRAAKVELASVFDVSLTELDVLLNTLSSQRKIQYVPAGNGGFWEFIGEKGVCDISTQTCMN
jgi:putative protein-disulfide isomerase